MRGSVTIQTLLLITVLTGMAARDAFALPAFAIREKVSCTMCHTNGSAPHLTEYGYLYRRAGFRMPQNIGNKDADAQHMTFQEHMAAGVNIDYEYANATPPGSTQSRMTANNFNVPEVELWPAVGAFLGNYGVWSEIDASPATTAGGGIALSQADLRYAAGSPELFFNFRGGMMAPEGYGASDQWLDDGNIPLMDRVTAIYNEDTLALPFGAMETPQLGIELGLNYQDSHLTVGIYNGFTGINAAGTGTVPLTAALMNQSSGFSKDYKIQLDQFVGELGAITASYYDGYIPLMDPTGNTFSWADRYEAGRLYLTWFVLPAQLDFLTGAGLARNQYVSASPTPDGSFQSRGAFIGLNYYVMPHLTLAGRIDFDQFNTTSDLPTKALGYALQASLPYENNLFVLGFNHYASDLSSGDLQAGITNSFRAEWRFLF